ncbi:MAG: DUF6774 domain-containing protein [Oscillospiraceae bacterium]|nr:hypothetical protein [Oscillospiraceae bacterium]
MEENSLPVLISAMANTIAAQTPNDLELGLLSAVFTQLGDTLATILALRAIEQSDN